MAARALHPPKSDNLGDLIFTIRIDGVLDQLLALVVGKVQIEVGHGDTPWVEEALKDQVVFEWVDAGDAGAIGDQRPGARTAHVLPDIFSARKIAQVSTIRK